MSPAEVKFDFTAETIKLMDAAPKMEGSFPMGSSISTEWVEPNELDLWSMGNTDRLVQNNLACIHKMLKATMDSMKKCNESLDQMNLRLVQLEERLVRYVVLFTFVSSRSELMSRSLSENRA